MSLCLAAAGSPPGLLRVAALVALVAVLLFAMRRRLPVAVVVGGWTSLVSLGAAALLVQPGRSGDVPAGASHVFAALAGLWYAIGCGLQRKKTQNGAARAQGALVYLAAAAACGLLATAQALSRHGDPAFRAEDSLNLLAFAVLAALGAAASRRIVDALISAAASALALATLRPDWFSLLDRATPAGLALLAGSAAALLSVAPALREWRRRRREWPAAPTRFDDEPPRMPAVHWAALALAVAAGVLAPTEAEVPFALAPAGLAAMACGGVAHHRKQPGLAGVLALLFTVETAVLACTAAVSTGAFGVLAGLSLGACWLAWLARFWSHQLLDGQAWTTAGRLVPSARAVSGVAAAAACGLAWSGPLDGPPESAAQVALGGAFALVFLLLSTLFALLDVRDGRPGSELTACVALVAAAQAGLLLLFVFGGRASGELSVLAVVATVIAIYVGVLGDRTPLPVSRAIVGAFFPLMIVFRLVGPADPLRLLAPASVALGAVIVLWIARPVPRMKQPLADI